MKDIFKLPNLIKVILGINSGHPFSDPHPNNPKRMANSGKYSCFQETTVSLPHKFPDCKSSKYSEAKLGWSTTSMLIPDASDRGLRLSHSRKFQCSPLSGVKENK
jgi:hypothetical protein